MTINYKLLKVSKRVAIIFLIAMFSIVRIVSCAADSTEPSASQEIGTDSGGRNIPELDSSWKPDDSGTNNPDTDNPEQPEETDFPKDTYYWVYTPFAYRDDLFYVSYLDTNNLTLLWKKHISRAGSNDGKRWFIRDANNNQKDIRTGSYYYFDKDFNIIYYRQGKGSIMVRKFRCGTIVKYKGGKDAGYLAIGGIYETTMTKNEITGNNFDQLNIFMGDRDMRDNRGALEVLTMNTGQLVDNYEFGVNFYYNKSVTDIAQYRSKNPDELDKFFSGERNLSWDTGYVNFKFAFAKPYDWHLETHPDSGWVSR